MIKNIIFDFMGVIADIDYKKLLNSLSFTDKFKALRLFVSYKTDNDLRTAFKSYQEGIIDINVLNFFIARKHPHFRDLVYNISDAVYNSITVNKGMINLIKDLRRDGFSTVLISNTTPETEEIIKKHNLENVFDGVLLSTKTGFLKPSPEIFNLAKELYGCKPSDTFFIDDTEKNIESAQNLGFKTISCKNSKTAIKNVSQYFYSNYHEKTDDEMER